MSDFGSEEGEEDQGPYLGVFIISVLFFFLNKYTERIATSNLAECSCVYIAHTIIISVTLD